MQHDGDELCAPGCRRISRHSVQASRRLVEHFARFESLRRLIVDTQFVLALEHIYKCRPWVSVRDPAFAALDRYFNKGGFGGFAVELFGNIKLRKHLY